MAHSETFSAAKHSSNFGGCRLACAEKQLIFLAGGKSFFMTAKNIRDKGQRSCPDLFDDPGGLGYCPPRSPGEPERGSMSRSNTRQTGHARLILARSFFSCAAGQETRGPSRRAG
jgi:hypothetical protein